MTVGSVSKHGHNNIAHPTWPLVMWLCDHQQAESVFCPLESGMTCDLYSVTEQSQSDIV